MISKAFCGSMSIMPVDFLDSIFDWINVLENNARKCASIYRMFTSKTRLVIKNNW